MKAKKWFLAIGSLLVPFVIMLVVWHSLGVAPFGDKNLLVSDLGTQYLEFMTLFKNFFEHGFHSYSFSNGIGGSIEALSGYYLISPFNLISLFFKEANLPVAIVWIITAKITAIGGTMYLYLAKHFKQTSFFTLVFSTAFSLCGFVVAYSLNFMWLDALVFLPLVVLGLEKLWAKESAWLYGITLFLTIITNYYLGYMVCLFAVFYSIYLYWLENTNKDDWKIQVLFQRWKKFFLVSLAAGLATSVILIPSLLGMLKTAKTDFSIMDFLPYPRFLFSVFSELGAGTYTFDMRLDHLPSLYSGIIIILLFFTYFFAVKVSSREKKGAVYLLVAVFASFIIQLVNTVWHMFQSPAGFPYRNAFIFSFLVIRFAYEGFLHLQADYNRKRASRMIWRGGLIFTGLLVLGQIGLIIENHFLNENYILGNHLVESLLMIWLFAVLLVLFMRERMQRWLMIAVALTCLELGINYRYAIEDIEFGSQSEFAAYYTRQEALVDKLMVDEPMLRLNQKSDDQHNGYSINYNSYNDGFLYNFSDISSYTSTLEKDVLDTLVDLGIYSKNERRFTYVDDNPVLNLLLNVRYSITPTENLERDAVLEENNLYVYQNPAAIGMGFLINRSNIMLESGEVIANQEKILQSVRADVNPYYREASMNKYGLTVTEEQTTFEMIAESTGNLFMYLPKVSWSNVESLTVNGIEHETDITVTTNQLFNLGHFEEGDIVNINLKSRRKLNTESFQIATLDEEQFHDLLAEKNAFAIELTSHNDDYLTGTVTARSDNRRLFLSIPYDDDWIVKIDGNEVETDKIYGSFLSVQVPEGTHEITLSYRSMPTLVGASISAVTILICGIYSLVVFIRKRK